MDLDITQLADVSCFPFSHSAAEGGPDAGRNTWQAAMAGPRPLLNNPEEFQAVRDNFSEYGAWSAEEIEAWTDCEVQALVLQLVASHVRESPRTGGGRADCLSEIDWQEHRAQSEAGQIASDLYFQDGRYYVYLGN